MKYFLACLIIPAVPILLIAVFGIGALYFGVTNLMERGWAAKEFPPDHAFHQVALLWSELGDPVRG